MPEMGESPRLVISTGWVRVPSQSSPQRHEQEMRKRSGQFSGGGEVRSCVHTNRWEAGRGGGRKLSVPPFGQKNDF